MKKLSLAFAVGCLLMAQEKVDQATDARFRSEELEKSQIMHTLHMLTDRYGPRVTGTPNHEAAAKWVVKQLTDWGLKNAHLEPWDFGHPGWSNERASALPRFAGTGEPEIRSAGLDAVHQRHRHRLGDPTCSAAGAAAPGASGDADAAAGGRGRGARGGFGGRGGAAPRLGPTKAEMEEWVKANQSKVKGKIVLIGKAAVIPVNFDLPAKRRDDEQVKAQYDPNNPNAGRGRGGFGGGGRGGAADPNRLTAGTGRRTARRHAAGGRRGGPPE